MMFTQGSKAEGFLIPAQGQCCSWEYCENCKEFEDANGLLDQWMQQFHTEELLVSHLTFLFVFENALLLTFTERQRKTIAHTI